MISNIRDIKNCPDCGSDNLVYSEMRDQVICRECGLVYEPLVPADEKYFEKTHGITSKRKKSTKKKAAKKKSSKKKTSKKKTTKKKSSKKKTTKKKTSKKKASKKKTTKKKSSKKKTARKRKR